MGNSEKQLKSESDSKINGFKKRFENLPDNQIERKLKEDLVPEAIEALKQIKEARKNES